MVLLVEGVVGFSPWRELLASRRGGSCCLRTVEEVVSLALWKKSLPLHPGGYHWPGAMEGVLWREHYGGSAMEGALWKERYGRSTMEGALWRQRYGGSTMDAALWMQLLDSPRKPLALLSSMAPALSVLVGQPILPTDVGVLRLLDLSSKQSSEGAMPRKSSW